MPGQGTSEILTTWEPGGEENTLLFPRGKVSNKAELLGLTARLLPSQCGGDAGCASLLSLPTWATTGKRSLLNLSLFIYKTALKTRDNRQTATIGMNFTWEGKKERRKLRW